MKFNTSIELSVLPLYDRTLRKVSEEEALSTRTKWVIAYESLKAIEVNKEH